MGDAFLRAFAAELEQTQRALPPGCLLCVPQARALVADEPVTQDDLYAHVLIPLDTSAAASSVAGVWTDQLGEYETLNGKRVVIEGSHVKAGAGFADGRKVRILLSEQREVQSQRVTVLHLSRPLCGGIAVPEDPNELDVATFRRYTAILRSFPENELVFVQLDETVSQVQKICQQRQFFDRYERTLPSILKEEWEAAVDELISAGSLDEDEEQDGRRQSHSGGMDHLLPIQQVVECYLMEELHEFVFPHVIESCREEDEKLQRVLHQMRHYTPEDFGIRKEFQCFAADARDVLLKVHEKATPLEMLLVFKSCIDLISDAITKNLRLRRLDFESRQLATDDILDQLLFVLVQASNQASLEQNHVGEIDVGDAKTTSPFPIRAVMKYISDYHFINSNTTALGFTIANFEVAIEYFLMKGSYDDNCDVCNDRLESDDGSSQRRCAHVIETSKCARAAERNTQALRDVSEKMNEHDGANGQGTTSSIDPESERPTSMTSLVIVGDWFGDEDTDEETKGDSRSPPSSSPAHRYVEFEGDGVVQATSSRKIAQIDAGRRFFVSLDEDGHVSTWGDSSGSRLGYALPVGHSRRLQRPRRVAALDQQQIVHVACGAFHTLATDINGHIYAWGNNSRGQLGSVAQGPGATSTSVETPSVVNDLRGVFMTLVACGEYHSLGLSSDGDVFSWGCDRYGKLGRKTRSQSDAVPQALQVDWIGRSMDQRSLTEHKARGVRRITAGKDHSLVVTRDGAVFTWGRGDSGQLGHGCYMDVSEPKQVMALSPLIASDGIVEAAGGNDFSLFLTHSGAAFVCGRDPSRALSHDLLLSPTLLEAPPTLVTDVIGQIAGISCGDAHFAVTTTRGLLVVSSDDVDEEATEAVPPPDKRQERRLVALRDVGAVASAKAGGSHTLALLA